MYRFSVRGMLIDCDTCSARGRSCGDCVVSMLLSSPAPRLDLDDGEQRAVDALVAGGLVPPIRLDLRGRDPGPPTAAAHEASA